MTSLLNLWTVSSFRAALDSLLSLSDTEALDLLSYVRSGEAPPMVDATADHNEKRVLGTQVLATLGTVAQGEGLDSVVKEVHGLLPPESAERIARYLTEITSRTAVEEGRELVERAQTAVLPFVTSARMTLDLRVMSRSSSDSTPMLAPVVISRLTFDEPIAGVGSSVEFQVPDAMLEQISVEISRVTALWSSVRDYIPPQLAPPTDNPDSSAP